MVVVLCDDYRDAEEAFRAWIAFLQTPPADEIASIDKYSLRVKTSDGQMCVFIDHRFKNVFSRRDVTFETINNFLDIYSIEDPDYLRCEYRRRLNND